VSTTTPLTITADAARSHWVRSAGLAEPVDGSLAGLVESTGWIRTLGGVDAYLGLLARRPDLQRSDVDAAIAAGDLVISPAARNCTYLLPGARRSLALAEAAEQWEHTARRLHDKAGILDGELAAVGDAVLDVLARSMTTDEVRRALPDDACRSLGAEGKAAGVSSTLPPALRQLEFADRIRRRPVDDRADTERYVWEANPAPRPDTRSTAERRAELAAVFAGALGPVGHKEFAAWATISQRDSLAALESADGLVEVDVESIGRAWLPDAGLLELVDGAREPIAPDVVRLLGFEDLGLVAHSPALWFDRRHHSLGMPVWGRGEHTLGGASHLFMRTVLIGDRMAGFWAWDPSRQTAEVALLEAPDAATRRSLVEAVERTSAFLHAEFGHARMTAIDGEGTEQARLAAIRGIDGTWS